MNECILRIAKYIVSVIMLFNENRIDTIDITTSFQQRKYETHQADK